MGKDEKSNQNYQHRCRVRSFGQSPDKRKLNQLAAELGEGLAGQENEDGLIVWGWYSSEAMYVLSNFESF